MILVHDRDMKTKVYFESLFISLSAGGKCEKE